MSEEFPPNSDASKKKQEPKAPKPKEGKQEVKIEKIVTGEIVERKPSLGEKMKRLFVAADMKSVVGYVGRDVLLPAIRNMIVESATRGIDRLVYGDRANHVRRFGMMSSPLQQQRFSYNSPIMRQEYRDPVTRPPSQIEERIPRSGRSEMLISHKEDAELVVERMSDIVDSYGIATLSQLYELMGIAFSHVDEKWGWNTLAGTQIRQVHGGYVIDFPQPSPIE